jgi:hypothetical protein
MCCSVFIEEVSVEELCIEGFPELGVVLVEGSVLGVCIAAAPRRNERGGQKVAFGTDRD